MRIYTLQPLPVSISRVFLGGEGGQFQKKKTVFRGGKCGSYPDVQPVHKLLKAEIKVQFSSVFERYEAASNVCGYVTFTVTVL